MYRPGMVDFLLLELQTVVFDSPFLTDILQKTKRMILKIKLSFKKKEILLAPCFISLVSDSRL